MSAPDILTKIQGFRVTYLAKLAGNFMHGQLGRLRPARNDSVQEHFYMLSVWCGERQPHLETTPDGTVEQFSMVGCRDYHYIARQLIELHEQERHYALDFAGLVSVATFLADRVEFVKEENARLSPHIIEQFAETGIRLAKVTADQRVVADDKEREGKRFGDCLGERRLAVTGGAG